MIREGDVVRAELHGHLDCYGGINPPAEYVRRIAEVNPPISVVAPIVPGRSIMKLDIVDEIRKAADRHGKIAVIAVETNTRQGHLEFLVDQTSDARLDDFAQSLPKFDEGRISAVDTAVEMYERFGALPMIVHPYPGVGGLFVHGMTLRQAERFVLGLREAHIGAPIGIEKYSSETDILLYPLQRMRRAQIDRKIEDLRVYGVGETASGDEHGITLGWAHVEFRTKHDISNADDFLRGFGNALVSHNPQFATRTVLNRTIQSYDEWWDALEQMAAIHGIPRIERILKMLKVPQPAIRGLDLSGRYASRNGQLTEERKEWRRRIQERAQTGNPVGRSFADIYHQTYQLFNLEPQPAVDPRRLELLTSSV